MSTVEDHPTVLHATPSEGEPQLGMLSMYGVDLSDAEYFVYEGDHVVRSREFDVYASGDSFGDALQSFGDALFDFGIYLGRLEERAENEEEMFHRLAPRLMEAARRHEQAERRARKTSILGVDVMVRRSGRQDEREWHQSSRLAGSSLPSLA
jgi:hypothetical protein